MPMRNSEMEQEIRQLRVKTTIIEERLNETRRSEELFHKIFAVIVAVFGILLTFILWNITRFQSDIVNKVDTARISLETQYNTALEKQHAEFQNFKTRLLQEQNLSLANAFIKLAEMRQNILDLEGALMDAVVEFSKMTGSGSTNWAVVLERMDAAIRRATMGEKRLPVLLLLEVDRAIETVERTNGGSTDQTRKLKETLKLNRGEPGP
jgi:hypothetical protein